MKKELKKYIEKNKILSFLASRVLTIIHKYKKTEIYQESINYLKKLNLNENLVKDILFSKLYYKVDTIEYFLYKFYNLNENGRREFIGTFNRIEMMDTVMYSELQDLFNDKYLTYEKFKDFYKRDSIKVNGSDNYKEYEDFCEKHKTFMAKPNNLSLGEGIIIINDNYNKYWDNIISKGEYILEEIIVQSKELACFNTSSVNTVRIFSVKDNQKVHNIFAFLKMGREDCIVDNLAAGGLGAAIDIDTGILISTGKDEMLNEYLIHPDSKQQIIGFKIPKWNELLELVNNFFEQLPDKSSVGLDLALTDKGWVVVEVNGRSYFIGIQMHGFGLRKKIKSIYK